MTKQVLVYEQVVPVSSQRHRDWSVKTGGDYAFAADINFVPLTAVEFLSAASEYTIVFAGKDENITPVVVLGLQKEQNLYLSANGSWTAKYVPAFVKRYPFVFSSAPDGDQFTLCIDEKFSGCNTEGRGERLFDSEGNRTQYLDNVLGFLRAYEVQFRRTRAFCAKLKELDVLEPMQATYTAPSGQRGALSGFMAVNREKLKAVPDEKLLEMAKTDELELAYLHLFSMRNFSKVLERSAEKSSAPELAEERQSASPPNAESEAGADVSEGSESVH